MTESKSNTWSVHPFKASAELPGGFVDPFQSEPHPLAKEAAEALQAYIASHPDVKAAADEGKMFGVLVVEGAFLAAYSGLLGGRNDWPGFVPPVFDAQQPDGYFKTHEREISDINHEIDRLEQSEEHARLMADAAEAERQAEERVAIYNSKVREAKAVRDMMRLQRNMSPEDNARLVRESQFMKAELHRIKKHCEAVVNEKKSPLQAFEQHVEELKAQRRQRSDDLQRWLFERYVMLNEQGEKKNLLEIFKGSLPPAGSGDCCAPKLLQYAFAHGLKPVCLAEFWWGKPPKTEIRHHLHFYPPCRGKCFPILNWMMGRNAALEVPPTAPEVTTNDSALKTNVAHSGAEDGPSILYEDDYLAVLVKPAGMLSVPGKTDRPSVEQFLRRRWHDEVNPLIVHRLDMDTSGLMVVARTKWAHQQLQKQFANHEVRKRYEAVLEGSWPADRPSEGEIALPLRPDLDDRPRQLVDPVYGKEARTKYKPPPSAPEGATNVSGQKTNEAPSGAVWGASRASSTSLSLFPLTGRTHQLRVHCAHPDGLGIPILGDALYGKPADRLYLHAAEITFRHPKTGEMLTFTDEPEWKTS